MPKIVAVSDTHLRHDFTVPNGDIIIHAGDACLMGDALETLRFAQWYGSLPHRHKVFVPGNHDFLFEKNETLARSIMQQHGIMCLIDECAEVMGLKIYGSPWQPEFCNWAFNLSRYDGSLAEKWAMIPGGLDILITHGPPLNVLDRTFGDEPVGCYDLAARILQVRPRVHVFGHVHYSYGSSVHAGTSYYNAAICDERYRPTNAPHVFVMP